MISIYVGKMIGCYIRGRVEIKKQKEFNETLPELTQLEAALMELNGQLIDENYKLKQQLKKSA